VEKIDTSKLGPIKCDPQIGTHLATLNLFREADGKVYITVAAADGAMVEFKSKNLLGKPIDYVEGLIYDAANSTLRAHSRGNPNGVNP
jgi:hypothetical protein